MPCNYYPLAVAFNISYVGDIKEIKDLIKESPLIINDGLGGDRSVFIALVNNAKLAGHNVLDFNLIYLHKRIPHVIYVSKEKFIQYMMYPIIKVRI